VITFRTYNAQSSCAVRVGCLCLLAAHTGLARLAALVNPNNGKLLVFIKKLTKSLVRSIVICTY
ncbi:hypothetical protein, partial [Arsukibacterium ikkense]|uniref:hypothetical protein n=1 Tax=Arsukibacterium ikkense TaxID=336831 RepID=UPI001F410784